MKRMRVKWKTILGLVAIVGMIFSSYYGILPLGTGEEQKDLGATPKSAELSVTLVDHFGSYGAGDGQFNGPFQMAINSSGYIYVTDEVNHRVQIFTPAGQYFSQWGGSGSGNGQFNHPCGIAINGSGYVYVSEWTGDRVQIFTSSGQYISEWGSSGTANGQFDGALGLTVSSTGYVYVADGDNNRIQVFDSVGVYITKWGGSGSGDGQFSRPTAIAINSLGKFYVADSGNYRVQVFDAGHQFISEFGGYGTSDGLFNNIYGVAVNSSDYVFVTDYSNDRIQVFTASGQFYFNWGTSGTSTGMLDGPVGIDFNSVGHVYVSEIGNDRVQSFDVSGSGSTTTSTTDSTSTSSSETSSSESSTSSNTSSNTSPSSGSDTDFVLDVLPWILGVVAVVVVGVVLKATMSGKVKGEGKKGLERARNAVMTEDYNGALQTLEPLLPKLRKAKMKEAGEVEAMIKNVKLHQGINSALTRYQQQARSGGVAEAVKGLEKLNQHAGKNSASLVPQLLQRVSQTLQQLTENMNSAAAQIRGTLSQVSQYMDAQNYDQAVQFLNGKKMEATTAGLTALAKDIDSRMQNITRFKKLFNLFKISSKVKLDDVQRILGMNREELLQSLMEWQNTLKGFKIDGDFLTLEDASSLGGLMGALDSQFDEWEEKEQTKEGKIEDFNMDDFEI
jgi:NHL repeat